MSGLCAIITGMSFVSRIKPEWALRIGLGLMYLYSGFDLFYNPARWRGFAPGWISRAIPVDIFLRTQGIGEIILGLLFLAWFSGRIGVLIASALSAFEMFLILIFVGVNPITFRDVGLLGAAIASLSLGFKNFLRAES